MQSKLNQTASPVVFVYITIVPLDMGPFFCFGSLDMGPLYQQLLVVYFYILIMLGVAVMSFTSCMLYIGSH